VSNRRPQELVGLAAAGVAVCCGLPVLLGAAVVTATAGVAVGSTLIAAAGAIVGVVGWRGCRHRRACLTEQAPERAPAA
jgi:hypothetical protein